MSFNTKTRQFMTVAAAAALALGTLSACSSGDSGAEKADKQSATEKTAATLQFSEPWAKAGKKDGMTGVFGTIENTGDADVHIVGASSPDAGMVELHRVVGGKMEKMPDGLMVAKGSSEKLEPGANHIMLMKLKHDLEPGSTVTVTLEMSDGTSMQVTAEVREYAGANEEYKNSGEHGDMDGDMHGDMHGEGDHEHGDHEHSESDSH